MEMALLYLCRLSAAGVNLSRKRSHNEYYTACADFPTGVKLAKDCVREDNLRRKCRTFSFFLFPVTLTFDLDIQTLIRFLYSAPNHQVSSSYVELFRSYCANKQPYWQTNKQMPLKTSISFRYWYRQSSIVSWSVCLSAMVVSPAKWLFWWRCLLGCGLRLAKGSIC